MTHAVEILLAIVGWCAIAGGAGQLMPQSWDEADRVIAGVFWPATLPLRVGWLVVGVVRDWRWAMALRPKAAPTLPKARARENDGGSVWR